MDEKQEQSGKEKVLVRLAQHLKSINFYRTKTTFFTRVRPYFVEFGHLYKFTFGPYFRVHFGIRIINDTYDDIVLNGLDSDRIRSVLYHFPVSLFLDQRKYSFEYGDSLDSIEKCANDIFKFWKKIGLSWFKKWEDTNKMINSKKSPLSLREKEFLKDIVNDPSRAVLSESTKEGLGIK